MGIWKGTQGYFSSNRNIVCLAQVVLACIDRIAENINCEIWSFFFKGHYIFGIIFFLCIYVFVWVHVDMCVSLYMCVYVYVWASLVAQMVKNLPAMWESWVRSLGWEYPLEEGMVSYSNILAWRIPVDRGVWQL